ncbi:MAG TPA: hypothetical protein VK464_14965, partial [Symbiobacteriaceae bacterium]|nr:hypothetical protein [Symbiobacteriaceae bacterium]
RRVALHCSDAGPLLQAVAGESKAQLQRLGAEVRVTSGETGEQLRWFDPDVLIGLRLGRRAPAEVRGLRAQPVERFRRSDLYLARALLDRVALQTGLPSRGVPLWAWKGPEQALPGVSEACATVVLECGCPDNPADALVLEQPGFARQCAVGLAEALLRFAGLPVEQVGSLAEEPEEAPEPVPLVSGRPRQDGPAPMVEAPDGHWVSPRAQALLERERRHAPDTPGVD